MIKITIELNADDGIEARALISAIHGVIERHSPRGTKKVPVVVERTGHGSTVATSLTDAQSRDVVLASSVNELPVKSRVSNALMKAGYTTIGHVVPLTHSQLREVIGIGRTAVHAIDCALDELHLR